MAIAFAAALAVTGCSNVDGTSSGQQAKSKTNTTTLSVYNWSDYIGEHTVDDFQKATGITVNYSTYESNESLDSSLKRHDRDSDVVVPTGPYFARQIRAGVLQPIDKSRLKNYGNIDPLILRAEAGFDPGNVYGVPYFWGTVGIGINVNMVRQRLGANAPVDSLDLLFKPEYAAKAKDCGIAMLDSPSDMFPMIFTYLGIDPHSTSSADFAAAEKLMQGIRPYIRYFHSSNYINDLANGELCAVLGWSGDVLIANSRATDAKNGNVIEYHIPKEGALIWVDILAIPKDAPNPENALKFIDYLLEPKVAADGVNYITYASAVKPALLLSGIDSTVLENPGIYPTDEVKQRLFPDRIQDYSTQMVMRRSWGEIKSGL